MNRYSLPSRGSDVTFAPKRDGVTPRVAATPTLTLFLTSAVSHHKLYILSISYLFQLTRLPRYILNCFLSTVMVAQDVLAASYSSDRRLKGYEGSGTKNAPLRGLGM